MTKIKRTILFNNSRRELCKICGFPKGMERTPVLIKNDIFSLMHYEDKVCKGCGHQNDGLSISVVKNAVDEIIRKKIGVIDKLQQQNTELTRQLTVLTANYKHLGEQYRGLDKKYKEVKEELSALETKYAKLLDKKKKDSIYG